MASSKQGSIPYEPLPSHQNVVVLSLYHHYPYHRYLRQCLAFTATIVLLSAAVFFLYPADPDLHLARIRINHIRVNTHQKLTLDVSFSLTLKVHNRDFFSLDYDSLDVWLGYRGRELGRVASDGGSVKARGNSYVNATLDLDGIEVLHDVFYLIEDLAKGVIPFDTVTKVKGNLGVLFFKIPLKAKVFCEVYVNTKNETISRQDCSAKV